MGELEKLTVVLGGRQYKRIKHGEYPHGPNQAGAPCHDCGVGAGEYHTPGCDVERCPRCHGQLITCPCGE